MPWQSKVPGLTEKVIELYPTMSSREIHDATGFALSSIIRCAKRNNLKHTDEAQVRIDAYIREEIARQAKGLLLGAAKFQVKMSLAYGLIEEHFDKPVVFYFEKVDKGRV